MAAHHPQPVGTTCCCTLIPNTTLASAGTVEYPLDGPARATFLTRDGKVSASLFCSAVPCTHPPIRPRHRIGLEQKVTEHHWAVYDFARTIPCGRVTTYGALCKALGKGSPRSGAFRQTARMPCPGLRFGLVFFYAHISRCSSSLTFWLDASWLCAAAQSIRAIRTLS
ncbi:hypothetical protein JVT61DRAFT_3561 [Boletus reticuloceps]|uniref:Methylated-DNA-[protein]-cysteine S-methyltransferase DNA binding domain-containing protein n=1 Tax=Boletus reticuloceps TaxID=495285 RepID=A0A8I2YPZ2_9AGAM|nr:hypothetical protein JVT61DRAFT_3561 [Boletus reticuloceps]